ncbi:DUF6204 family protein [Allonocardiopsis opalescens]|uniref:Uncharacterized protein n=1 Tax=Allonocardiopsis opalescens TaxID=1144618 RepID=A0A2T0Q543_9ACTN|nr:DUF6204 family protein [Allonocardiopsis opalescens]PRX98916.1 hypothetical protein CLV72_104496 [Allonocardiopsis opalescens]
MFRVTISGAFDGITEAQRAALRADADAFQPGYTETGAFTTDRALSAFTFRCQVPAEEPTDGEPEATRRALAALDAHGYPHRVIRVAVTDMRDIKIRRRNR